MGHQRLRRWYFPSPITAGVASTSDFEEYGYDQSGNQTSVRRRDCRVITNNYDALERLTATIIPDGASTGAGCAAASVALPASATRDIYYRYDNRGLQTATRFDSAVGSEGTSNVYDRAGRLTSTTLTMGGVARTLGYQWNRDGVRTRVTHPDGNYFTYVPDDVGRIIEVRENGANLLAAYAFNNRGEMTASARGGVGATTIAYDTEGRVTSYSHDLGGTSGDMTTGFGYNPANQVTMRTCS